MALRHIFVLSVCGLTYVIFFKDPVRVGRILGGGGVACMGALKYCAIGSAAPVPLAVAAFQLVFVFSLCLTLRLF